MDVVTLGAAKASANKTFATKMQDWSLCPPALHVWDAAVAKRASAPAVGVFVGDSLPESLAASTYRKSMVPVLQDLLRARYPTVGQGGTGQTGGLGYIAAAWPSLGNGVAPQDCIPTYTGTVTPVTGATTGLGLGRRYAQIATASAVVFPAVTYTDFDIIYSAPVTSGVTLGWAEDGGSVTSVAITAPRSTLSVLSNIGDTVIHVGVEPEWMPGTQLAIDSGGNLETAYIAPNGIGVNQVTLSAPLTIAHAQGVTVGGNGNGGYIIQVRGRTRSSHVITISNNNGSGTVNLEGIRYYDGDVSLGVQIMNAGHGGIRADQYLSAGATDHWSQSVAAMLPALILCELLINDSGSQSPATYIANLTALRLRINNECVARGLPIPSWVQVIPYQIWNATNGNTNRFGSATWQSYVDALIAWAAVDTTGPGGQSGIYLVDIGRRMPNTSDTSGLYNADLTHPTDLGVQTFCTNLVNGLPVAA